MGGVSKEEGVLKLVRAGGIVEVCKHPITAAEVMERYPRHCVTRPDFFTFPYIVVKPESVLKLGRVFFIVPHHTIRRLLQSKGYPYHSHCTTDHYESVTHQAVEYAQPLIEPNFQRSLIKQYSDKTLNLLENIDTSFYHQMIIRIENSQNNRHLDHKPKIMPQSQQGPDLSVEEKRVNCIFKYGDYNFDEAHAAAAGPSCFLSRKKGGELVEASKCRATSKVPTTVKPCLKKHQTNKTRSQQGPRVRFKISAEDDDEKWDTDFSVF